jgi:hypothetical protein
LEGGLDGLAGELSGEDGGGFNAMEDLSIGCLVGGAFELLGEQQRLFEEKGLQGGLGLKGTGWHRWFLQKMSPD